MFLFIFLISCVVALIAFFLNNLRMFVRDMYTLMDLHRIWFNGRRGRARRMREVSDLS